MSPSHPRSWSHRLASRATGRLRGEDLRFADEDILTVIHAGESGLKLADVCAAADISFETYYRWKAKYGGLRPDQLRARRLGERRRQRAFAIAVAAVIVGGIGAGATVAATRLTGRSERAATAVAATPAERQQPPPVSPAPSAPAPILPTDAALAHVQQPVSTNGIEAADPGGFSVQVAALPALDEARQALVGLSARGYPAYMTSTTVNDVSMYRVRVGPLRSHRDAEQTAARLEREGYPAPWITK